MREMRDRTLQRAAYIREFIFTDTKALSEYLQKLRGNWYILKQESVGPKAVKVTVVQQYNGVPIWEG